MIITLGTDNAPRAHQTADLLQALRFPAAAIDVVHVLDGRSAAYYPVESHRPDLIARYMKMQEDNATSLLATTVADLKQRDFADVTSHILTGYMSNKLLDHCAETHADLLALASSGKGPIEGLLIGSTTRKAALSAPCSVLISKRDVAPHRPLNVVLATDHSAYANACIDTFVRWAPRGIGKLTVATVFPEQLVKAMTTVVKNFKADVGDWVRSELDRSNQQVIQRLAPLHATCTSRVESGTVVESLDRVMKEESADLLILGAQGHGFVDRLMVGSVSLEMVVRRPYSILVVRARGGKASKY